MTRSEVKCEFAASATDRRKSSGWVRGEPDLLALVPGLGRSDLSAMLRATTVSKEDLSSNSKMRPSCSQLDSLSSP